MYERALVENLKCYWSTHDTFEGAPVEYYMDDPYQKTLIDAKKNVQDLEEALSQLEEHSWKHQTKVLNLFAERHARPDRRRYPHNIYHLQSVNQYADEGTQSETEYQAFNYASESK